MRAQFVRAKIVVDESLIRYENFLNFMSIECLSE